MIGARLNFFGVGWVVGAASAAPSSWVSCGDSYRVAIEKAYSALWESFRLDADSMRRFSFRVACPTPFVQAGEARGVVRWAGAAS